MKKFILILTIVFLFCFSPSVYAATNDSSSTASPQYEPVCGSYASHWMVACGLRYVDNPNGSGYYIYAGSAWQCARCKMVMVTEGDLYWGEMSTIGKYATVHNYADNVNSYALFLSWADHYGYCSTNSLAGYSFHLSY